MKGTKTYRASELVLEVKKNSYNPETYPLDDWERYIDILCQDREYQKEAIKTAIIYFITEKYKTIEDLVEENYQHNLKLSEKYSSLDNYKKKIQLQQRKSGCLDLATGTGKSYVMFGIAQIALGLGIVDRVLVLGPPSTTIEKGLTEKFIDLSSKKELKESIPESSRCKSVEIISANRTITDHCICVENINAVYNKTNSSIKDSLMYTGGNCLVLNDEVHHAYNKVIGNSQESKSLKKWKEFLLDNSYNFKYILGFTGTAYIENDYFNDVIYRYSLMQAIVDGFVKRINYVDEDTSDDENEKFQKILANHLKNKQVYNEVKPMSILITRDIKEAKMLKTRLVDFLHQHDMGEKEYLNEKVVLLVTSDPEHKDAVEMLPNVDNKDIPVEWIISVAMLTEGWDVKNVFQIVPMEEKAFNSKLLIAQVLGRGLRIPPAYPKAEVKVFNHSKWSKNIKNLVNELLEQEEIFRNHVITEGDRSIYNFSLYNLTYKIEKKEIENTKKVQTFKYGTSFNFESEVFVKKEETRYIRVGDKEISFSEKYEIEKEKNLISDVVNQIVDSLYNREYEPFEMQIDGVKYTNESLPPYYVIDKIIRNSLKEVGVTGEYIGKANTTRALAAFNTLLRRSPKSVKLIKSPDSLLKIETTQKPSESVSYAGLLSDATIFYSSEYDKELDEEMVAMINKASEEREVRGNLVERGIYNLKTPSDLIFTYKTPEESFVKKLTESDNSKNISAWIKSSNMGFYSIDYSIRKNTHQLNKSFNPDFFIKIDSNGIEYISVIEIKDDGDDSDKNKQKYKYAKEHFDKLNDELKEKGINQKYLFNFLTPNNYSDYFEYLSNGLLLQGKFKSKLDNLLEERDSAEKDHDIKNNNGIQININVANHYHEKVENVVNVEQPKNK